MYKEKCQPLVQAALFDRCISTIFAFGATGSGKSYTMLGFNPSRTFTNSGIGGSSPPSGGQNSLGIYMLAANDIFSSINSQFDRLNPSSHISVYISYFEIYGNKLYDLLNDRQQLKTQVDRNENVCIIGLSELPCSDVDNLKAIVHQGNISRRTGCTGANSDSSRSHAILQIAFKNYHDMQTIGKVSFIDLAGSERGQDTIHNDKQTRMEGASINSSLLALKECIRAQDSNSKHVPFRQSQLTQVLKESFSGNCMTLMIVNISPGNSNCEQTLNSLRYASRYVFRFVRYLTSIFLGLKTKVKGTRTFILVACQHRNKPLLRFEKLSQRNLPKSLIFNCKIGLRHQSIRSPSQLKKAPF
jgi:kinesin family protein 2/24